jgi:hypothetical protein
MHFPRPRPRWIGLRRRKSRCLRSWISGPSSLAGGCAALFRGRRYRVFLGASFPGLRPCYVCTLDSYDMLHQWTDDRCGTAVRM